MALKTKLEVVDEIRMEVYGGMPPNTASISENFVLRLLNNRIAEAAVKSSFASYNLDGCVAADDIFFLTYTNVPLLTDTVLGLKYFTHPAQPIGIPSKRAMIISPPVTRGGVRDDIFKGISRSEVTFIRSLPRIKKVFHYTENGREYFLDEFNITETFSGVNLSIMSSGANDLTAFLNLPDDMITAIKLPIIAECKAMMGITDTTPMPQTDNPQPRN